MEGKGGWEGEEGGKGRENCGLEVVRGSHWGWMHEWEGGRVVGRGRDVWMWMDGSHERWW